MKSNIQKTKEGLKLMGLIFGLVLIIGIFFLIISPVPIGSAIN
jgi:uncharacterized membrane protein